MDSIWYQPIGFIRSFKFLNILNHSISLFFSKVYFLVSVVYLLHSTLWKLVVQQLTFSFVHRNFPHVHYPYANILTAFLFVIKDASSRMKYIIIKCLHIFYIMWISHTLLVTWFSKFNFIFINMYIHTYIYTYFYIT